MDELPTLGSYFCPHCLTRVPMELPTSSICAIAHDDKNSASFRKLCCDGTEEAYCIVCGADWPDSSPPPPSPSDATIEEAVVAYYAGQCIFIKSTDHIWFLTGNKELAFVCVTIFDYRPVYVTNSPTASITEALADGNTELYIAPSLSTVLNAYDL